MASDAKTCIFLKLFFYEHHCLGSLLGRVPVSRPVSGQCEPNFRASPPTSKTFVIRKTFSIEQLKESTANQSPTLWIPTSRQDPPHDPRRHSVDSHSRFSTQSARRPLNPPNLSRVLFISLYIVTGYVPVRRPSLGRRHLVAVANFILEHSFSNVIDYYRYFRSFELSLCIINRLFLLNMVCYFWIPESLGPLDSEVQKSLGPKV